MTFDGTAFGKEVVGIIKAHIAGVLDPIVKRLDALEQRAPALTMSSAVIDRNGHLIVTRSDGSVCDVGAVCGKDGDPGTNGLGFDDLDVRYDGARAFTLRFERGEQVKEFTFTVPVMIDRGVYRDGTAYAKGDGTTWGGSFWIAQEDTGEKPGTGKAWRLAVKKGRDGKDAAPEKPKAGPISVGVPAKE